jgi:hypothetical protein
MRALLVLAVLATSVHADPSPPPRQVWIDVRAYDMYRCVTSWEEVCAGDAFAVHRIELTGERGIYHCAWGLDEPFEATAPKIQGYPMTIRRTADQLDVKGPNLCFTGDPWEKVVSQGNVSTEAYRFVPLADFEAMRKRAMAIVPGHACPNQKVRAERNPKVPCLFRAEPPPPKK